MRIKKDGKIEEVKYPSLTKAADALGFKIALLSHYLLGRICWPEGLWGAYEKDLEIQEFLIEA
jgi:hypothetical protein